MKALLKSIGYSLLPERFLRKLKSVHYRRTVGAFAIETIPEYPMMSRLVQADSAVLDIGANIGIFSKCFSFLVGPEGEVFAFEPVPQTFEILSANVKLLAFPNVIPLQYAVSDIHTTVTMEIPSYQSRHAVDSRGAVYQGKGDNFYEAKIIDNIRIEPSSKQVTVETMTVDSYFAEYRKPISFIKCDVEGHELQVIRGSLATIRKYQPALLIEVMDNPRDPSSPAFQLFEVLTGEGYAPFSWKDGLLKRVTDDKDEINFFFLTSRHLSMVDSFLVS